VFTEPHVSVLLGLPFHACTLAEALADCQYMLNGQKPYYCITANADFVAQAYTQEKLRPIFFYAERVFCDGMPLVWVSKLLGGHIKERITGADLTPELLHLCQANHKKVYFLGSDEITLSKAIKNIRQQYPNLMIAGYCSPPMSSIDDWDNLTIVKNIQDSKTDLLLLALGCPKQELWIARFYKQTHARLTIGIGASLNYIAYPYKRAPKSWQKIGFEWAWRLLHEPKRLISRYLKDSFYLLWITLKQYQSMRALAPETNTFAKSPPLTKTPFLPEHQSTIQGIELKWSGKVERATLHLLEQPYDYTQPIIAELSQVTFIDSSGLGLLAKMARQAKQADQPLCIFKPSATVERTLKALHLTHAMPVFHDRLALENYIAEQSVSQVSH
jgi:N-acetylglucosaminyldiphosphoundecaprenol N-acetyl-beta-D-mannosaminyltransferase